MAMNASANAGNDCNFDTFQIQLREFFSEGATKNIIQPTGPISTGHTTLTGTGTQSFLYEEPFTPNWQLSDNTFIVLSLQLNVTVGTATTQQGIYPMFPYQKTSATKWNTQSGVYLLGRSTV